MAYYKCYLIWTFLVFSSQFLSLAEKVYTKELKKNFFFWLQIYIIIIIMLLLSVIVSLELLSCYLTLNRCDVAALFCWKFSYKYAVNAFLSATYFWEQIRITSKYQIFFVICTFFWTVVFFKSSVFKIQPAKLVGTGDGR